jgi:aspartokinase
MQHVGSGSRKAEQQDDSADAQLDRLLANGKLLDAALYAAQQQQRLQACAAMADKPAAGAQVVVAVHAHSSTTDKLDAAADGYLLQGQQQQEQQVEKWQVSSCGAYVRRACADSFNIISTSTQ